MCVKFRLSKNVFKENILFLASEKEKGLEFFMPKILRLLLTIFIMV